MDTRQRGQGRPRPCPSRNRISPLSDEALTGREAVTGATQGVSTCQIEDTAVNGMDYILLAAEGKIAKVTIVWRPLPSAVEMQGHLAPLAGRQPWELRTNITGCPRPMSLP